MKTIEWKVAGSVGLVAAGVVLTSCSSERDGMPPEPVESSKQTLPAVPEDDGDFQVEATIDHDGNIIRGPITKGAGVPVPGFDLATLSRKSQEPPEPPREKIARSLAAKLRPTDPNAKTEVIVSIAHDAHFSPLPKLLRDESRSSTENSRRLSARLSAIADVDRRRKPFRTAVANHARGHGAVVTEEFTMGNGLAMTIPDSAIEALANHPNVLDISPGYGGTPPPGTIANGTSLATGMNSDFWRPGTDGDSFAFYMITFDTGVRSTHTVFNSPDRGTLGFHRDCVRGNNECLNNPVNLFYNDQDEVWNHGTPTANIIMGGNSSVPGFGITFRGVGKPVLDYVNVYNDTEGFNPTAVGRAWARAAAWGDDVIVAELQMPFDEASQPSLAADDAFDQGIAVIAAVGNVTDISVPASPGNAHKALAVGAYDAVTNGIVSQVSGSVGGRFKPDFQAPSNVTAASKFFDTDSFTYGGTSAATAFAGGAAAIMYEWHAVAMGLFNKPGNLYTALLAQGSGGNMPGLPNGVGRLKMESGSWWWSGQITLGVAIPQDLPFSVPAGRKNLKAAIWWPERQSDAHNDVDLRLIGPAGEVQRSSTWSGSVWEKVAKNGNLTPGNYAIRITPFSMPRPPQVVYFTIITSFQ